MYFSDNFENLNLQPEDDISELIHFEQPFEQHQQQPSLIDDLSEFLIFPETNSPETISDQVPCSDYDTRSFTTEQNHSQNSHDLPMQCPTDCSEVLQPDPDSNLDPPDLGANDINVPLWIVNLVNNVNVATDSSAGYIGQVRKEHESDQFSCEKNQIKVIELDSDSENEETMDDPEDSQLKWQKWHDQLNSGEVQVKVIELDSKNMEVTADSEDSGDELCKQRETYQFNSAQVKIIELGHRRSDNSEDSNDVENKDNETGQLKRKILVKPENVVEDLENLKITKRTKRDDRAWFERSDDFFKNGSLWSLLWCYGLRSYDVINQMYENEGKDYVYQIENLINIEAQNENQYQIITADGKVWLDRDLSDRVKLHLKAECSKKAFCVSKLCKECPYKTKSAFIYSVMKHIYRVMGVNLRCVLCGWFFIDKRQLKEHVRKCIHKDKEASGSVTESETTKYKIKINRFEDRFLSWTRMLIENIKLDNYLTHQLTEKLIEQVKKEIDFNFVDFYKQIDNIDLSNQRYSVEMKNDDYYSIVYWQQNSINTDPRKSAIFKIVNKREGKAISLHQLANIKRETSQGSDNKCHYKGCSCHGLYTSAYKCALIGHVLASNILIVCVGCNIGFTDIDKFEEHLTKPECFVFRVPLLL